MTNWNKAEKVRKKQNRIWATKETRKETEQQEGRKQKGQGDERGGCEEGEREPRRGHQRNPNSVKIRNGTKQSLEPWRYPQSLQKAGGPRTAAQPRNPAG